MMAVSRRILQLFVWYVETSRNILHEMGPALALMLTFTACGSEMNLLRLRGTYFSMSAILQSVAAFKHFKNLHKEHSDTWVPAYGTKSKWLFIPPHA